MGRLEPAVPNRFLFPLRFLVPCFNIFFSQSINQLIHQSICNPLGYFWKPCHVLVVIWLMGVKTKVSSGDKDRGTEVGTPLPNPAPVTPLGQPQISSAGVLTGRRPSPSHRWKTTAFPGCEEDAASMDHSAGGRKLATQGQMGHRGVCAQRAYFRGPGVAANTEDSVTPWGCTQAQVPWGWQGDGSVGPQRARTKAVV